MQSAKNTYGWFKAGIGLGVLAGLTLLVNSIANYQRVSQIVMMDHVRQDLASQVAVLDQQIRSQPESMPGLVAAMQANGRERIAWIQVRTTAGQVVAHAGRPAVAAFSPDEFRKRWQARQPAFRTLETPKGQVVVEAFPVRLPAGTGAAMQPTVFRTIANEGAPPPQRPAMGVIEMAGYTSAANTVFWPVQRNLMINMTAAVALLMSLGVMAFRFRSYVAGQKLEEQVAVASEVQRDLLSPARTQPAGFALAAECRPASALGGDFYDSFASDDGGAAFVLGDVAGKGVPAALLMGVIHGAVRSSQWTGSAAQHIDSTARINRLLCEQTASSRYASMFWGYFDRRTNELRYVNAGHLPPLVFRAGAAEPVRLEEGGPVLGLLPKAGYQQGRITLEPGDTMVLYTDGTVESANRTDEMFGEERLVAAAKGGGTPEEIRERVLHAVNDFAGEQTDADDRTLLVIRYLGPTLAISKAA